MDTNQPETEINTEPGNADSSPAVPQFSLASVKPTLKLTPARSDVEISDLFCDGWPEDEPREFEIKIYDADIALASLEDLQTFEASWQATKAELLKRNFRIIETRMPGEYATIINCRELKQNVEATDRPK